ncbi:ADP-L-glycero-D-manno-heptose-6-epimerase [uncultured archaeon]|nr:ADP-L-glycero-D-manno-heptose-6-epimerase [uncultured archaeon]
MKTILLTGAAGFIGFSTAKALLARGDKVIGIDNLNNYYDPKLKEARLEILSKSPAFRFQKADISKPINLPGKEVDQICHLAAQAGVRYSFENPQVYLDSNILGTLNVLKFAKDSNIQDIVYASSSSVYGNSEDVPFREDAKDLRPVSLYAATKLANERIAEIFNESTGINTIGLRFFTVYGPWGRPDMALFKFTDKILKGEPIEVYNNGNLRRDFTYVDDIVSGITASLDKAESLKHQIFNLGRGQPVNLMDFITEIENATQKPAQKIMMPMQQGDVNQTYADTSKAKALLGYCPKTSISKGVKSFVDWYKEYYKI